MSISVRKAFKNVFSDNYNKTNMIVYLVLCFIICLINVYLNFNNNISSRVPDSKYIITLLVTLAIAIIVNGIYTLAVNNGYNNVRGVIPDVLENFPKILAVGFKLFFGFFFSVLLLSIISGILISVPIIIAASTSPLFIIIGIVLGILFILLSLVVLSGAYLIFLKDLKFVTYFRYIQAFKFICASENVGKILIWGLKCLFFSALSLCFTFSIGIIALIAASFSQQQAVFSNYIIIVVGVIGATLSTLFSLIVMDLTIQLLQALPEQK